MVNKRKKRPVLYQLLLIAGIVIVINIISEQFFFRLDLTADREYTLSRATKDILKNLSEPVTITAYFTEDVPPQLQKARQDFKDLLVEYSNRAKGNIVYEFINPNKSQELERKAMQEGIMPNIINVRERDQMTQKRVFLGAVLKMGDQKDIIPVIQTGTAMEFALSSSIKKLSIIDKPLIGYIQGNGEPSRQALQQVMAALTTLYNVEEIKLDNPNLELAKYRAIALVAPTDTIPPDQLARLDQYLGLGGKLFIAINRVAGNFQTIQGTSVTTGLEDWLSRKGIVVENDFLVDVSCGSVGVQQQQGMMNFTTNVSFPYLPVINTFEKHPITEGLEQVILPFASTITYNGDTAVHFIPIAKSSKKSGTIPPPVYFDINKKWTDADFPLSYLTVAAAVTGRIGGNPAAKMVVIGDGDFAVNGEGQRPQQLQPDNINLMVNSIDWLTDDTGLIGLRTKAITARPLDTIDEGKKALLRWVNFLLPIILVILYGIFRNQRNRAIRIKRMEEGYV
jgi:gliding-associated putative ABC transporter substrate-binding component GldG